MDKDSELTIENKNISDIENNLQIGFTIEEMAIELITTKKYWFN